jgi:TolA-binding protein
MYRKEARELLEQVIRDYPETDAAAEAHMRLQDME